MCRSFINAGNIPVNMPLYVEKSGEKIASENELKKLESKSQGMDKGIVITIVHSSIYRSQIIGMSSRQIK